MTFNFINRMEMVRLFEQKADYFKGSEIRKIKKRKRNARH